MAEKVLMLALSPTMEEGTINRWHKKEGDAVTQGEVICEVETDKATMDYESVNQGILLKILVPEGGKAKVGEAIAVVGKAGEDIGPLVAAAVPAAVPAVAPAASAASVAKASSAAAPSVPRGSPAPQGAPHGAPQSAPEGARGKASPLARRLAAERGLDLRTLRGSGPGGRVVKRDVERVIAGASPGVATAAAAPAAPAVGGAQDARDQVVPLSSKRRIIARRLSESKFSAPHYYLKIDAHVDSLLAARARFNEGRPEADKVSFNVLLLKFVALALRRHPQVNSGWQGESIVRFGRVDIGLAVAQADGLITPVLRDCDVKGVQQISRELAALVDRARANRLTPEEYTGATFTVSSLGSAGILEFTAIINPPGSAILAVGRVHKVPVVDERDQVVVRSRLLLTLSCDHRVIDGAVGAAFLADLKRFLENPIEALL